MASTEDEDFDAKNGIIDAVAPQYTELRAIFKKSFAYHTFRVRLPNTLKTLVNALVKDKDEHIAEYGEAATQDIEAAISDLNTLLTDVLKNAPLFELNGCESDTETWNSFIRQLPSERRSYYSTCWLYAECYIYRKLSSIFKLRKTLVDFDYFANQKQTAARISADAMLAVAKATRNLQCNAEHFKQLLKLDLWGNRCDLSITSGKQVKPTENAFEQIAELDANLLIDSTNEIWTCIDATSTKDAASTTLVDIVCDNAGFELYTDLIIAEYIVDKNLASKVRFNVKAIPWFVSDVTANDFEWTLKFLSEHESPVLSALGKKLNEYVAAGKFEVAPLENFWTSPYEYYKMHEVNPALYARLAAAQLVIFKGDLNYRKLIGDFAWPHTDSFQKCLRGFQPTNLCTLRTVKADLICGLAAGVSEALYAKDKDWMYTGDYGIIQYSPKTL